MILKISSVLLMTSLIASCGGGSSDEAANRAQNKQNNLVEKLYGSMVGTYNCSITETLNEDESARLIFLISSVPSPNSDGTPGIKKVPVAVLRREIPVVQSYALSASGYRRETGDLAFNGKDGEISSILGKMIGRHYSGAIQTATGGRFGKIDCDWINGNTTIDGTDREFLLEAYRAVAGLYKGKIIHPTGKVPPIPVAIELSALLKGSTPYISGFWDRLDFVDGVGDIGLEVVYRPEEIPAEITMNGRGNGNGAGTSNYRLDIDGTVQGDQLILNVNSLKDGYMGRLVATLVEIPNPQPGDVYPDYIRLRGVYKAQARIRDSAGKRVKVEFVLTLTTSRKRVKNPETATGKYVYTVKAQLSRSDQKSDGAGVTTASFQPTAQPKTLELKAKPGESGEHHLQGTVLNGKLKLHVHSAKEGDLGELTFTKQAE